MDNKTKFEKANKILNKMNINLILFYFLFIFQFMVLIISVIGLFYKLESKYYMYLMYENIVFIVLFILLHIHYKICNKQINKLFEQD